MTPVLRSICGALAACILTHAALAQDAPAPEGPPATLVADRVEIAADGRLIASGGVEVIHEGVRLTAGQITYDPETEGLEIAGPITLIDDAGAIVLADSAALSTDLRNGLLRSARLVLDRELQLAATEITRVDGRYTQLTRTVTSSCEVCAAQPVPLWQIRSEKVIHDELERQLYFENARFDVLGVPVFWLPRLRLPDPTLDRATGFLTPSIRTTDELGFGVKIPYFVRLGPHRDLTLTPYIAVNRTQTLEARYRQAFVNGEVEFNTAVSVDDILPGEIRGYLFGAGSFELRNDFDLSFDIKLTSDDAYLLDYDYSGQDRLDSRVALSRARRDAFLGAELIAYRSLRSSEDNETQPFLVGDAVWIRRFEPPVLGGIARFMVQSHGHQRNSTVDVIGRDVGRLTGLADWRRDWTTRDGIILETRGQLRFDQTYVNEDSNFPGSITDVTPTAAVQLRWPWIRAGNVATHVLEPAVQLAWSPTDYTKAPIDESTQLEFDEGNLFALSRFPAGDVLERGLRGNVGLGYTRIDPDGWSLGVTVGRIFREDIGQFDGYDILEGTESDWLASLRLDLPESLSLSTRALFDDDLFPARNDLRLDWTTDRFEVAGTYTWLRASDAEMRPDDTNEWRIDGAWQIDQNWRAEADWRYDLRLDRSASARIGLEYRTECARFDLSVRRRFTSSESIRPSTDVNFEIALEGFGNRPDGRPRPRRPGCAL